MALNNFESRAVYLSVADGQLVQQFKEVQGDTKERVTKTGKLVHERFFRSLDGLITKIATKENDYGKQWQITFTDGEENYVVSFSYSSRYASSFLKVLPNIEGAEPVRIMPWSMADKQDASKKVTGITLYQNDGNGWVKIAPAYTKEDPNGLPQMKKIKVKGKEQWDDTDMMAFLEEKALQWVEIAKLAQAGMKVFKTPDELPEEGQDDLPF